MTAQVAAEQRLEPCAQPGARTIALVGRANAGKTSLLMHLTGSAQQPVNFPGTSVERVESCAVESGVALRIVDLPGIASLQAVSPDEALTLRYLWGEAGERPDLLCAVVDASKLAVELRLLQRVRGLGLPVVVALTKCDVAEATGLPVDTARLAQAVGLPLVQVHGGTGEGAEALRHVLATVDLATAAAAAAGGDAPASRDGTPGGAPGDAERLAASVRPMRAPKRTWTDRFDRVLLHRVLGPLALLAVLFVTFQLVFTVAEPFMLLVEGGQGAVAGWIEGAFEPGWFRSFVVDGLVNGLGTVLVFVPQIALLIAFVTVLEQTGYMARAVFLLDRPLRKVGLTGRSFVPLTSSFACAIPGILAARIIEDERDRLATIAVAPLMSCSARLPVYVVLLAAFFPKEQAGVLLLLLYVLGIVVAAGVAFVLRRTTLRGGKSLLAMELPVYQRPALKALGLRTWTAVREFLRTAGTVILVATVVVWLLGYFPRPAAIGERFDLQRAAAPAGEAGDEVRARLDAEESAAYLEQSALALVGRAVQPVFAPAGFDWKLTVGILAAFPARELVVPTLGTLHSLGAVEADPDAPDPALREALVKARDEDGRPVMNGLIALAAMAFFALCSQCAATLAAIRRETHSWRWPVFTFVYMTVLAWAAAVAIYQVGSLLGYGLKA